MADENAPLPTPSTPPLTPSTPPHLPPSRSLNGTKEVNGSPVVHSIVIFISMMAEAQPIIEHFQLEEDETNIMGPRAPCKCFLGTAEKGSITVIVPAKDKKYQVDMIGTVPAALISYLVCERLTPDLIINAGTAGSFQRKGAEAGDIFLATRLKYHDRRMLLPGFAEYGTGDFRALPTPKLQEAMGWRSGIFSTGDSLDLSPQDDEVMQQNGAIIKDMEAAAIASSADLFETPLISIKVVTDLVDTAPPSEAQFMQNIQLAGTGLQEAVPAAVSFCIGKTLAEL